MKYKVSDKRDLEVLEEAASKLPEKIKASVQVIEIINGSIYADIEQGVIGSSNKLELPASTEGKGVLTQRSEKEFAYTYGIKDFRYRIDLCFHFSITRAVEITFI